MYEGEQRASMYEQDNGTNSLHTLLYKWLCSGRELHKKSSLVLGLVSFVRLFCGEERKSLASTLAHTKFCLLHYNYYVLPLFAAE